jgi:hypothetical protein
VKKCWQEQKHFIRQPTDKGAKGAERTTQSFFANLCVLAPWREIVLFFPPSDARGTQRCVRIPHAPARSSNIPVIQPPCHPESGFQDEGPWYFVLSGRRCAAYVEALPRRGSYEP